MYKRQENGRVRAMECIEMELGEPDASGRRKPIAKEGSNFELPVDTVIMSIGTSPVSYTHLDVYKRQFPYHILRHLP